MVGQLRPIDGAVIVNGADTGRRNPSQNARDDLILVPEGARSFPDLCVRENLEPCRFIVRDA
jgi:ABC-type branched-subunit amino acid transport system ATPase component